MRIKLHFDGVEETTIVESQDRDFIGTFLAINEEIKNIGFDRYVAQLREREEEEEDVE